MLGLSSNGSCVEYNLTNKRSKIKEIKYNLSSYRSNYYMGTVHTNANVSIHTHMFELNKML